MTRSSSSSSGSQPPLVEAGAGVRDAERHQVSDGQRVAVGDAEVGVLVVETRHRQLAVVECRGGLPLAGAHRQDRRHAHVEGEVALARTDDGTARLGHRDHRRPDLQRRSKARPTGQPVRPEGRRQVVDAVVVRDGAAAAQHHPPRQTRGERRAQAVDDDIEVATAAAAEDDLGATAGRHDVLDRQRHSSRQRDQPVDDRQPIRIGSALRRCPRRRSHPASRRVADAPTRRARLARPPRGRAPRHARLRCRSR